MTLVRDISKYFKSSSQVKLIFLQMKTVIVQELVTVIFSGTKAVMLKVLPQYIF